MTSFYLLLGWRFESKNGSAWRNSRICICLGGFFDAAIWPKHCTGPCCCCKYRAAGIVQEHRFGLRFRCSSRAHSIINISYPNVQHGADWPSLVHLPLHGISRVLEYCISGSNGDEYYNGLGWPAAEYQSMSPSPSYSRQHICNTVLGILSLFIPKGLLTFGVLSFPCWKRCHPAFAGRLRYRFK